MAIEEVGFDRVLLLCFEPPGVKVYLVHAVAERRRELDFQRWQRMSAIGRKIAGRHSLEFLAIPPREREMFYQVGRDFWWK